MPTVAPETVIGVRTPAAARSGEGTARDGDGSAVHVCAAAWYFEVRGCTFLIEYIGDYADCVAALEKFLPYVDNWATCDQLNPKVLGAHRAGAYGGTFAAG